jgi:hypothetical protein
MRMNLDVFNMFPSVESAGRRFAAHRSAVPSHIVADVIWPWGSAGPSSKPWPYPLGTYVSRRCLLANSCRTPRITGMGSEESRMDPSRQQPGELPGPHVGQPILTAGPSPESAACTLVLVHGPGASAESILALAEELRVEGLAANQPYLDSALWRLESIAAGLLKCGVPGEQIALLGFSQGACLTLEFTADEAAEEFGTRLMLPPWLEPERPRLEKILPPERHTAPRPA